MRIVLDTNVFVSGVLFSGFPGQIIKAWGAGKIDLVVSPTILDEYIRVAEDLAKRKGVDITPFIQMLAVRTTIWNAPQFEVQVCSDPDDDKFLECAVYSNVRYIVTGDKALLAVTGYKRIQIFKPADFVQQHLAA